MRQNGASISKGNYFIYLSTWPLIFLGVATWKVTVYQIADLLVRNSEPVDIAGLTIAEHIPWDALALKAQLENCLYCHAP